MALYAFDGTWNSDKPGTDQDTDVVWFHRAYTARKRYWTGVGTRFGVIGRVAGSIGFVVPVVLSVVLSVGCSATRASSVS